MAYVLTQEGGRYYSLYGWTMHAKQAVQFPSQKQAQDFATQEKINAVPERLPEKADPGVSTGYDPFGVKARHHG